jgi:hypothetical protein
VIIAGLGYTSARQGRLAERRALLEEGISENIHTGSLLGHAYRVAWLSEVCWLAGCYEEAWQHARQTLDLAHQQKERGNEARAAPAWCCPCPRRPPDVAQAAAHYQQALAFAEEFGMHPYTRQPPTPKEPDASAP